MGASEQRGFAMSLGGQGGRNGTEVISSPISSEGLGGPLWGTDRTTHYRVVLLSPCPPTSSASSRSPSTDAPAGEKASRGLEAVPQPTSRPFSAASPKGGRDKPPQGAGPVPLSPTLSPKVERAPQRPASAFLNLDEAALFDERAAIREHDAGMARQVAERLAWGDVIAARAATPTQPQAQAA